MADYIPSKDSLAVQWAANFAALITAAPTNYGLVAGDAVIIQAAADAYSAAYAVAIDPPTRTAPTVAQKDVDRASMESTSRPYANVINANTTVTDQQRTDLGLTVRDKTPTPNGPIIAAVALILAKWAGLQLCIQYGNPATPTSKARPAGTGSLTLEFQTETAPGSGIFENSEVGGATKSPSYHEMSAFDTGKRKRVRGWWVGTGPGGKIQIGPKSAWTEFLVPL
jgi:hypothetical protein